MTEVPALSELQAPASGIVKAKSKNTTPPRILGGVLVFLGLIL
jgi:hypothetical protein